MRKLVAAAFAATALSGLAAPAAFAAPDLPPTDPVRIEGTGCHPDYPCTIQPQLVVDKTYPSRVVAWAKEQLPTASADTAARPLPPLPVIVDGGPPPGGCGDNPCTPRPYTITVDKQYVAHLIEWINGGS